MARAGRKRKLDAKRRTATTQAAREVTISPTAELLAKRAMMSGDPRVSTEFPLDILLARKLITPSQRAAGTRFAYLAWSIYGFPLGSCAAHYQRMISGSLPDGNRLTDDDPLAQERRDREHADELATMLLALRPLNTPRKYLTAVQNCCQYLRLPAYAAIVAQHRTPSASDNAGLDTLRHALSLLVEMQTAERRAA